MTTDEQALKLLKLAEDINKALAEDGMLNDTLSVSKLSIHVQDKLFAALVSNSKAEVETEYHYASLQGRIVLGDVEFAVCHNLI